MAPQSSECANDCVKGMSLLHPNQFFRMLHDASDVELILCNYIKRCTGTCFNADKLSHCAGGQKKNMY